jgi:hypothetical protein
MNGAMTMSLNTLVLKVLDSPLYRLLPGDLTQICYIGAVSGRSIRLPAQSVADRDRFLVVAGRPEHKRWWRSFRHPRPARLVRGGRQYDVRGGLLSGEDRTVALATYLAARPTSRGGIAPLTPVIAFQRVEPPGVART